MADEAKKSTPVGEDSKSTPSSLEAVIQITVLNPSNTAFTEKNGFLSMKATVPDENGEVKEQTWERVFLHRAFPFDMPDNYISVLDPDQKEIGMIRSLSDFPDDTRAVLNHEIHRKYYCPEIVKINSLKERYGFSYWSVELRDHGRFSITVQDTYRSLLRATPTHLFVMDVDGNRFEIPDVEALDRASYKRLELYL